MDEELTALGREQEELLQRRQSEFDKLRNRNADELDRKKRGSPIRK
jgi:hypothetical protein